MRVIAKKALREFWRKPGFADSEGPLLAWWKVVNNRQLNWQCFADVKATYGTADKAGDCVVFDIGGNKYRLVCKINFQTHCVFVRAVMSHKEYDNQSAWFNSCGCQSIPGQQRNLQTTKRSTKKVAKVRDRRK